LFSRLLSRELKVKIYETKILSVFYGCETLSVTIREEYRPRFLRLLCCTEENIWTKLGWCSGRVEKVEQLMLHTFNIFQNIIRQIKLRRMRWEVYVARMDKERKSYKVLGGKARK
jgi:hypothetical protein